MESRNQRSRIMIIIGIWFLLLLLMLSCGSTPVGTSEPVATAPGSYLNLKIVYTNLDMINSTGRELGFVTQDGLSMISFAIDPGYEDFYNIWQYPLISNDGKILFVTFTSVPGTGGEIIALPAGEIPIQCGWQGLLRLAQDGLHVWVNTGIEIDEYHITDCGTENPHKVIYRDVESGLDALSPDKRYIAVVLGGERGIEEHIVVRDLETGEERDLGNGNFPVWSRDGDWLAFTGTDGIYVFQNNPDTLPIRLISMENVGPNVGAPVYQYDQYNGYFPPIASWSPDGQWIVYHVCLEMESVDGGGWVKHYSIIKTNVETGETVELADNGVSPFWRWSAQP